MVARSAEAIERKRAAARAYYAAHRDYFARYHADRERRTAWNAARRTPEYRARSRLWPSYGLRSQRSEALPRPPQLDVDELTERAMHLVGLEAVPDAAFDAGWRDLVQEAVLAMLEGRDPVAAVRAERSVIRDAQLHVRSDVVLEGIAA